MITMTHTTIPDSRSANRSAVWKASCDINGQYYEATSRHGAPLELARVLIDAAVEDQPVTVGGELFGVSGLVANIMTYPSLYKMAKRTIAESASQSVHDVKWRQLEFAAKL